MRILVGKCFGLGNAVLTVPLIKALSTLGQVDVLVGSDPDDAGALDVFSKMKEEFACLNNIYIDRCSDKHDVAIMAIPFDGRWQNGVHFHAQTVLDGRKRPNNIDRLGFDMWQKTEVAYQMEIATLLGYQGSTPTGRFMSNDPDRDLVFLGIGFKRDAGGFGLSKNFGTDRFALLMEEIRRLRPSARFISTGSMVDFVEVGCPLMRMQREYTCTPSSLRSSWSTFQRCGAYIGNDTGAMHVAASLDIPTYGLMSDPHLMVKNPPLSNRGRMVMNTERVSDIAADFVNFVWGQS